MGILKALSALLLLGALLYIAVTQLDAMVMARLLASLSPGEVLLLVLFPLGVVLARAFRFSMLMAPKTRQARLTALYAYGSAQSVASLPTGIAGRAAVMQRAGVPLGHNAIPLVTDSFFDIAYLAVASFVVALMVPVYRAPVYLAFPAAICLLPLLLKFPPLRRLIKRLSFAAARRAGKVAVWKNLRRSLGRIRGGRGLLACAGLTLLANGLNLTALWCAVTFLDLRAPLPALLISITVPALFGRIVFVPGSGSGVIAGMAAILAQTGGLSANEGAVVAILYRCLDMGLPVVYGWLCWTLVPSPIPGEKGGRWSPREVASGGALSGAAEG